MPTVRKTITFPVSDAITRAVIETGVQTFFWPLNLQAHFSSQVQSAQVVEARKLQVDRHGLPRVFSAEKSGFEGKQGLTSVSVMIDQNAIAFEVDYDVTVA